MQRETVSSADSATSLPPPAHGHSHAHSHSHAQGVAGAKLAAAVVITLAFVGVEIAAGFLSRSLALWSDAGHNLADAAALAFSAYALWVARKPSNRGMTFGYHRVGILAALVNAVSIVVIAIFIAADAVARIRHPQSVNGILMSAVAAAGVAVNLLIGFWLHPGARHDLNIRSAYLHMLGDAISAAGVVIAGIVVALTGRAQADLIVSLLITALILHSSWGVLRESVHVLLEGTPAGLDMANVINCIRGVSGVIGTHDLHVWTVGSGVIACSCHIVVAEQTIRQGQQVLREITHELAHRFNINHTTIQTEVEGHCPDEMYCNVTPGAHEHEASAAS